ncbi:alpha/beta hydrolase [Oscillatoria sp. CS-180]|uniref:alpha/beta fold hydrolase n=1 Tax=Oscillatoria sp. CS-180 TaxID=3021720 RepID=UPI00232D8ECA|nr:alpha/beta hydrolase [Oscillatoria sp. CS-180]MDB9527627.1 alpha/beta hydrolase [Oscillatoria sp. CS-180]
MTYVPDALWIGVNPSLSRFDQRLFRLLNRQIEMHYWGYCQTADEPCCMETALSLLHEYMQQHSQPIHLVGHGLSGALGLVYARLYPTRVKSLTLLSVGVNPTVGWQAHYYALRNLLPCDRYVILLQMVGMLFGPHSVAKANGLVKLLEKVLDTELSPHSLADCDGFSQGGIHSPLLICHGAHDAVVDPKAHSRWQQWLQPGDRLWTCPQGRHFFHDTHAKKVSPIVLDFWHQAASPQVRLPLIELLS